MRRDVGFVLCLVLLLTGCSSQNNRASSFERDLKFQMERLGKTWQEDFITMLPYRINGIDKLAYSLSSGIGIVLQEDKDGNWGKVIEIDSYFNAFVEIEGIYYFGIIEGEYVERKSNQAKSGMIKDELSNHIKLYSVKTGDDNKIEEIKLLYNGNNYFDLLDVEFLNINNTLIIFGIETLDSWFNNFRSDTGRIDQIEKDNNNPNWITNILWSGEGDWTDNLRVLIIKNRRVLFWTKGASQNRRNMITTFLERQQRKVIDPEQLVTTMAQTYDVTSSLNNIYLTWLDHRNEVKNFQLAFSSFPPWRMNYEVFYKRSSDGGENWEEDEKISGPLVSSWDPAIAARGNLVVAAWSSLHKPARFCFDRMPNDLYYRTSVDGGKTWGEIKKITDKGKDDYCSLKPKILIDEENIYIFYVQGISGMTKRWRAGETKGLIRHNWEPWDIMMAKRPLTEEEKEAGGIKKEINDSKTK